MTDESRKAAPHSCLQHISINQTYIIVVKVALESQHPEVINHTAAFFHILINGEVEGLLDNKLFSRSLLDLVRYTITGPRTVADLSLENELIELLFEIATKIRLDPDILPAWFHPERDRSQPRLIQDVRRNQFPLFFVLVNFVHHDGQAGDFARTGLLYLTETASKSKQLETWMIESDLAPQMASGLGALYSRLSRQFPPMGVSEKTIPILALSDTVDADSTSKETRESFTQNMTEFLTYLAFWQDTIHRCKSQDVEDTLLDHFQVLFVQQLLYPSLLESSDVMGGSTAAVVAHLARILLALENQVLAQRMLGYLLASKVSEQHSPVKRPRARPSVSRRKSLDALAALAEAAQSPSPDLFNLLDLITMSLKSRHDNTVNSCLKLLSVVLTRHHSSVLTGLFKSVALQDGWNVNVKTFNDRLVGLFDLAGQISLSEDVLDESYQGALDDAKFRIERHSCSITDTVDGQPLTKSPTTIATDCKLLRALLSKLDTFFLNDTLTNLGLTQCVMDTAACENFSLYGWLLPSVATSQSTVLSIVNELVQQIQQWRGFFPEWDVLLAQRRRDLQQSDDEIHTKTMSILRPPAKGALDASSITPATPPRSVSSSRPVTPPPAVRGRPTASTPNFGSIDNALSVSPTSSLRAGIAPRPAAGSPLRQSYVAQAAGLETTSHSPSQRISEQDHAADMVSDEATNHLLRTMVTLDLASDSVPEESLPHLPVHAGKAKQGTDTPSSEHVLLPIPQHVNDSAGSGTVTPTPSAVDSEGRGNRKEISLSHILTNAVILQEFILEIAAMIQVRGTMLGEVDIA